MSDPADTTTTTDLTGLEEPTQQLVAGTVGDRCVSCGAPLGSDQRYCVNCGERRGAARFTLPPAGAAESRPSSPPPPRSRMPRASSGATLIAGVGTLLLAMGVGVLIGHDTANSGRAATQAAAPPTVITVGGGGGASSATSTNGTVANSSGKSGKKTKASKNAPSAAVANKANQAAAKVLGSSAGNLPPATVTQGQSGNGAGFNKKTHKFDGSFFGQ